MPAPKRPNTAAATAAVRRAAQERKASALRAEGWVCIPPEAATEAGRLLTAHGLNNTDGGTKAASAALKTGETA